VAAVGLAAVKLLPAMEFNAVSIRGAGLSRSDLLGGVYHQTWAQFREQLSLPLSNSFIVAAWGLGLIALAASQRLRRSATLFYLAATLLLTALSFDTPLFDLYAQMPLGNLFRLPTRFRWMASVLAVVLIALGTHAFLRLCRGSTRQRALAVALPVLGTGVFAWLAWAPPDLFSVCAIAATFAAALWAAHGGVRWRWLLPASLLMPIGCYALLAIRFLPTSPLPMAPRSLWARAQTFAGLRDRMSLQDRAYVFEDYQRGVDWSVVAKSSSLFDVRGVTDYEPETSVRFADLLLALRGVSHYANFNAFEFAPRVPRNGSLLNLTAARFVVANSAVAVPLTLPATALHQLDGPAPFALLENTAALPRAFYVPRAEVEPSPNRLLDRLQDPSHDPRQVALIEAAPADGFLGAAGHSGDATVEADRGEWLAIRVRADAPGFLFLSDQDYPGWEARVNGAPVAILRANYAFRLLRVPAGESTVELSYRPRSLRLGAAVSATTVMVLALTALVRRAGLRPA